MEFFSSSYSFLRHSMPTQNKMKQLLSQIQMLQNNFSKKQLIVGRFLQICVGDLLYFLIRRTF